MKDLRPGHHYAVIKADSSERHEKGQRLQNWWGRNQTHIEIK